MEVIGECYGSAPTRAWKRRALLSRPCRAIQEATPLCCREPGVLEVMNEAGEHLTTTEQSPEDQAAAVISDVENLARHGHIAQATYRAASLPSHGPHPFGPMLGRLRADGYTEEAAVIELGWRQPVVLHQLHVAERAGWVAAVVAFLAFFWPARLFAAIPAMGARLLVSEIYLQLAGRSVLESLPPEDRHRTRVLYDLSIYSTRGTNRIGGADAVMLTLGGVLLYGGALWARTTSASPWFVWAMTASGTIMAFAGGFAVAATRRLALSGIKPPKALEQLLPAPIERPPAAAIESSVAFRRPRIGRSLLLPAFLVIVGVPTVMERTPVWVLVGGLCLVAAVWLTSRAVRSAVVVGPDGVQYIGVVRTREWSWDEIHDVRVVTARDSDRTQSLRMVTADGADRRLVSNAGRHGANPELLRLCDSMNRHATAPSPGPTQRAMRSRLAGLVVSAFLFIVFGLFVVGAMFGSGSTSMNAAEVPAGRAFTYFKGADGSLSQAFVECPSLASHVAGAVDPPCDGSFKSSFTAAGVLVAIEGVLLVGMILVGRSYRRLMRERTAARRDALEAGVG